MASSIWVWSSRVTELEDRADAKVGTASIMKNSIDLAANYIQLWGAGSIYRSQGSGDVGAESSGENITTLCGAVVAENTGQLGFHKKTHCPETACVDSQLPYTVVIESFDLLNFDLSFCYPGSCYSNPVCSYGGGVHF
jgi:hypothetical protein